MKYLDAFKKGKITGVESGIPEHIVTAISNIFVFQERVYKIYKNDNDFFNNSFNDLSKKDNRFLFTRNDFDWNNKLSPEVYLELRGIATINNKLELGTPGDNSEELVIVMNRLDMSNQLLKRLIDNRISKEDCFEMGSQLAKRVLKLEKPHVNINMYDDFIARHGDLVSWLNGVENYITKEESQKYLDFIRNFILNNKEQLSSLEFGPCLDIHADNAVFIDNVFLPIDTYAPKKDWLIGYKLINLYRVATDIYAFLGKDYFKKVLEGYKSVTGEEIPQNLNRFLVIYCELIVWPYQYMLSKKETWRLDLADRYHSFIKNLMDFS